MATYAATITSIRRLLKDYPLRVQLAAAHADTVTETSTVGAADIGKFVVGQRWEHDDGGETGAEQRYVTAVNASTNVVTATRGAFNSTAATHSNLTWILKEPKYPYDETKQLIDTYLDTILWGKGLYDIAEHQILSSATTDVYDAPTTSCQEFLLVYQKPTGFTEPVSVDNFSRTPVNVDSTLYANARMFSISGGVGVPALDVYYVNCKHKLAIGTLTTGQERMLQYFVAAELIMWEDARRLGESATQGDRTKQPGVHFRIGEQYRSQADEMLRAELSHLRTLSPPYRVFQRN